MLKPLFEISRRGRLAFHRISWKHGFALPSDICSNLQKKAVEHPHFSQKLLASTALVPRHQADKPIEYSIHCSL